MSAVYEINKGVMKAIEFKGIKGQYITYLAIVLVALLLLFAILYLIGLPGYIILVVVGGLGYALVTAITRYSHRYGEHGLMKEAAYRKQPGTLVCRSRQLFNK